MNNSLYGKVCMNPLHFLQSNFLQDEEKIMKSISKPNWIYKEKIEYDSPENVGVTILE